jgi:hypothetical protein
MHSEGFIEAIWPAWNPLLSQAADVNSTETLYGHVLAFVRSVPITEVISVDNPP